MPETKLGNGETKAVICCACSQQCGVLIHLEADRIVDISGDKQHPGSCGFICVKGARAAELHYRSDRINWPLKRAGARGEGKWKRIEWEQALDEIAATLIRLRDSHGPESIAMTFGTFHGADWGSGERFLNLLGSPNSAGQDKVCYGPTSLAEMLTYGFGPTFYTYPVPGVTKCMVLWGLRPSASAPLLWSQMVKARRAGARLIVVDPIRTTEARQADLWIQLRPGSDAALAMGWLNVIIGQRLYDRTFVESRCIGFEALAERASQYPPAKVSETTWVPEASIVETAQMLAQNEPAILAVGNGLCQIGLNAVQAARALACLVAITGNLNRLGGHQIAGPPKTIVANGDAVSADQLSPGQRAKRLGAERYPMLGDGYKLMDDAMAAAWYGQKNLAGWTTTAHEPTLWRAIASGAPYPVKALLIQHHNPVGGSPNAKKVVAALQSPNLDLVVVHDLFMSPTAQFADYILPASHWLEKPFFSTGFGTLAFVGDYAEANYAALEPKFERRSDYELWRDLGRRMGQEAHWPSRAEELWDEFVRPAGLTFAELARRCGPWTTPQSEAGSIDGEKRFGTPSGKVELESGILRKCGIDPLPAHRETQAFETYSREYPMVLTTGGRMIEGFHQNAQQMPWFRKKYPHPVARVHPHTAGILGVRDGEWIAIETPVGSVRQVARLTEEIHPRVIQADRWWYPERAGAEPALFGLWDTNINVCTEDDPAQCDPVMGAWPLRAMPCRVARLEGERPA